MTVLIDGLVMFPIYSLLRFCSSSLSTRHCERVPMKRNLVGTTEAILLLVIASVTKRRKQSSTRHCERNEVKRSNPMKSKTSKNVLALLELARLLRRSLAPQRLTNRASSHFLAITEGKIDKKIDIGQDEELI